MSDDRGRSTGKKRGVHQVALNQLWNQLPSDDRKAIAQIAAQMIARQISPLQQKEESDERSM